MLSSNLLAELQQIMVEEFELQLEGAELSEVAHNLLGVFETLESIEQESTNNNLIISKNENEDRYVRTGHEIQT